jgi:hypothetical protein
VDRFFDRAELQPGGDGAVSDRYNSHRQSLRGMLMKPNTRRVKERHGN